jgi:hypothetical protein
MLITFALESYVRPTFFNFAILKLLRVQIIQIAKPLRHLIHLLARFKSSYQIGGKSTFIWCYECNCSPLITCTASSAHTVDVIFKVRRANIINNQLDVFNVKSSGANTSCNHYSSYFVFKVLNCELSVCLVHATM